MELLWSERPGCFERHLQRKHNNPLFPPTERGVTQAEVDAARTRDSAEAGEFRLAVVALVTQIADLANPTALETIARLREMIERLLDVAAELGPTVLDDEVRLRRVRASLADTLRNDAATKGSAAEALLAEAEEFQKAHLYLRSYFIAQAKRGDSPIQGEANFVRSLLSEDPTTIRGVVTALSDAAETLAELRRQASALVDELRRTEIEVPDLVERLAALDLR